MSDAKWLQRRGYVHFDRHIRKNEIEKRVTDPDYVAQHAFMPFIGYSIDEPRYKRAQRKVVLKQRPIRFASHLDTHVYAYYAHLLFAKYEQQVREAGLGRNVVAYRKHEAAKCNIHFANEVFEWIKRCPDCTAIALDVESFFDSLDHAILKARWQDVLCVDSLPDDHYRVFRAITRYSWVEMNDLKESLGIGRNRIENSRKPYCFPRDFREKVAKAGLIRVNRNPYGIPQGSPMSALLSNIFLFEFDKAIATKVKADGGLYRRYSDDILLVIPSATVQQYETQVESLLASVTGGTLRLNQGKTVISKFTLDDNGTAECDKVLSYLGFDFNGRTKLIRPRTVARYQRRVIQGLRSAKRAAKKASRLGGDSRIRRKDIYERYSHLGKRNFITYAYRCAEIMDAPEIRHQVRKHWDKLNRLIDEAQIDIDM